MDDDARSLVFAGVAFLTGLVLGLSAGLLLAPQTGAQTRRRVRNAVSDFAQETAEQFDTWKDKAKETVSDLAQRGKRFAGGSESA